MKCCIILDMRASKCYSPNVLRLIYMSHIKCHFKENKSAKNITNIKHKNNDLFTSL